MNPQTRTIYALLSLSLSLAVAAPLSADTFNVNTTTDAVDATPGDGVAATAAGQCSLRAAVMEANALVGPHTIVLPAGVFRINLPGRFEDAAATGDLDLHESFTIVGAGSASTIIDARGLDRAFQSGFLPATPVVLRGLAILNGDTDGAEGGVILHMGNSALTLDDVQIRDSRGTDGGAIRMNMGDLTLTDCSFANTTASGSGGAIMKTGPGTLTMTGCRFQSTSASSGDGGAVFLSAADVLTMDTCTFENTRARKGGGAVIRVGGSGPTTLTNVRCEGCAAETGSGGGLLRSGGGPITIDRCVFASNEAGGVGGGALLNSFNGLTMRDTHIINNTATDTGGGMYTTGTSDPVAIENVNISGNTSFTGSAGGFFAGSGGGTATLNIVHVTNNTAGRDAGGAYFTGHSLITAENCLFLDNTAQDRSGGGLLTSITGEVIFRNSVFSDNSAMSGGSGGGLAIHSNGATLENCLVSDNNAIGVAATAGGAYLSTGITGGPITNCTFSGNTATQEGGALVIFNSTTITNCTFADNGAGFSGAAIRAHGPGNLIQNSILAESLEGPNCFGALVSGGNNIDEEGACGLAHVTDMNGVDPLIEPLQDNGGAMATHALLAGSPAIDAGGNIVCPAADQRGVNRPLDGDGNGVAGCDIGAFEFVADCNGNRIDDTAEIARGAIPDCNTNGIPDDCESPDVDGDGLYDICDTCIDSDGDGFGDQGYPTNTCPEDGCATDPAKSQPGVCGCGVADTDTDADGVLDCRDNCPTVPNADQADGNGDGIGDACEGSPGPAPTPGCGGACGIGVYPLMPMMLIGLWYRRRRS